MYPGRANVLQPAAQPGHIYAQRIIIDENLLIPEVID